MRSQRRCSAKQLLFKIHNINRKVIVLEYIFNNVTGLQTFHVLKKRLDTAVLSVNIAKSLRTPTLKNIYEGLLLQVGHCQLVVGDFLVYRK